MLHLNKFKVLLCRRPGTGQNCVRNMTNSVISLVINLLTCNLMYKNKLVLHMSECSCSHSLMEDPWQSSWFRHMRCDVMCARMPPSSSDLISSNGLCSQWAWITLLAHGVWHGTQKLPRVSRAQAGRILILKCGGERKRGKHVHRHSDGHLEAEAATLGKSLTLK